MSTDKTKIDLIKIKQDFCGNIFGTAPCTATGEPCFNTFPTCKDQSNFTKSEKVYEFISGDIPSELVRKYNARPFIKSVGELPTEIKENDTVVKVLKDTLLDTFTTDIDTDPYYNQRSAIRGSFWKKWIVRNKNYKGRFIERYEGNELLSKEEFKLKFAGRIENITLNNDGTSIEATDILKKLSEIEYPLKTKYTVKTRVPNYFIAASQEDMLQLTAKENDFCERQDFITFSNWSITAPSLGGHLIGGSYKIRVVAYDDLGRPFANKYDKVSLYNNYTTQYFSFAWGAVQNAEIYKIFILKYREYNSLGIEVEIANPVWVYKNDTQGLTGTITDLTGEQTDPPETAQVIYQLNDDDATDINNWGIFQSPIGIPIDANSDLNNSGYIKLGKEIIKYETKLTNFGGYDILYNVSRMQFDSEADEYPVNSTVFVLFNEAPQNPFTLLKKMHTFAGISQYASSKFTEYEQSWIGINFSCPVIAKEMKLNKIYFDLVNVLDCISWVSENGLIEILKRSERPGSYKTITDKANIIDRSGKRDLNQSSRFTSWYLYWNKWNVEADNEDATAYNYADNLIDLDTENVNNYNDKIEDKQFTIWINLDCAPLDQIQAYVNNLLESRRKRTREAQEIYECDLWKKDSLLETGELFELSTNDIQDIYGNAIQNKLFRVIKKTVKGAKFNIKAVDTSQQL